MPIIIFMILVAFESELKKSIVKLEMMVRS